MNSGWKEGYLREVEVIVEISGSWRWYFIRDNVRFFIANNAFLNFPAESL